MEIAKVLFWVSILLLGHTYVGFPLLLRFLAKGKKQNQDVFSNIEAFPTISILLAVYNEEQVIEEKIKSTFKTNYPLDKIEFLIGSDASTDGTEQIIKHYQEQYPQIKLIAFEGRTGKPGIINRLAEMASNDVFVITDANVFFTECMLEHLLKHFMNSNIALVGGNIVNYNIKEDGISHQEKSYLKGENLLKYQEGVMWGAMIGTFGGVYAIRKEIYEPVPSKYTVDDFYISMVVLEKKKRAIMEMKAIAYEDVSNQLSEEFRRKVRISMGNYQNLIRFMSLLSPFRGGVAFSFWSHKVLRWLGPFFILVAWGAALFLSIDTSDWCYVAAFSVETLLLFIPFVDSCFKKLKIHLSGLRFISHFVWMNIALLYGFLKFITGVKSNIWTPTQRYQ